MTKGVRVILKEDTSYPSLLAEISDPPAQLYCKGECSNGLFENCLAVVGSRHMTSYGRRVTEQLVGEVAQAGVTIVSGFMYGIDATAHKAAVDAGGKTIAVMPCGIERMHPEYQEDLYQSILNSGGLILSEWDGNAMPAFWTYPKRNRIVAGLCKAVLVVEAGLQSGSLITAELGKKFGRKVFAVPGPLTSEVSKGTAQLIQGGASLVVGADDILNFFAIKKSDLFCLKSDFKQGGVENSVERKILEVLQRESVEADRLARELRMPAAQLGTRLSLLELQGIIKQEGGKYYVN